METPESKKGHRALSLSLQSSDFVSVLIKIPDLGAADDQVTLVKWLVCEGEDVVRGQTIATIETDKAVVELESVATGTLLKRYVAEGQDATVGDVIGYVGRPGDLIPETRGTTSQGSSLLSDELPLASDSETRKKTDVQEQAKPLVSPLVRNLARQMGVNLDDVIGTGIGGVITRQDVLANARLGKKTTEDGA